MNPHTAPDFGPPPRGTGLVTVAALHVTVLAALLQLGSVGNSVSEAGPLFVSVIAAGRPEVEVLPPAKISPKKEPPRLITSEAQSTSPMGFVAPPLPVEPVAVVPAVEGAPALPVAAPVPKVVTSVEYIRRPQVEYPAASRRLGEQGRVLLRVLIDLNGRAERIEAHTSSGSRRLDEAAIKAAGEAVYRPYTENGQPIPVWALVPTVFELSDR